MKEIRERRVLNEPIDKKCPDRQTQRQEEDVPGAGDWEVTADGLRYFLGHENDLGSTRLYNSGTY